MNNSADEIMVAEIRARTVMAELDMQRMLSANKLRESEGSAQAYGGEAFGYVRDDLAAFLDQCNIR